MGQGKLSIARIFDFFLKFTIFLVFFGSIPSHPYFQVQYKCNPGGIETRTIEISSSSCGIRRGRLDSAMEGYISTICKKNIIKIYFKKF